MTRQDLFAMLEAKTYADWFYGDPLDKERQFKKNLWLETHKFCVDMKIEMFPNFVVDQLWKEKKI